MPISQNTALFSLLGTTYGGDGKSTFALPDLQGRAPMHPQQGPGLSLHDLGESSGSDTVTLLWSEIPIHNHAYQVSSQMGLENNPSGQNLAQGDRINLYASLDQLAVMSSSALAPAGGDQPHNNLMPYLTFNFCIALQGVFPPRN